MSDYFDLIYEYRWMFAKGILLTLGVSALSTLMGVVLGMVGALARLANAEKSAWPLRALTWLLRTVSGVYLWVFRGTPLFVQLFVWAYVWFPAFVHPDGGWILSGEEAKIFRQNYGPFLIGVLALGTNSGAYITEIFRAGIQSIDRGQMEAARSLGLSYGQAMRYIIVPQAVRRMLPPLGNEFITLLKDSSLVSTVALAELMSVYNAISGRFYIYKEPAYTVALLYLAMTSCLTILFAWLEKRYGGRRR
ncbi:amino acid ABC transporter permease [Kingella sp. SNUBH-2017]|uniref:Amino acid ABC transporter permease n=1 Tax=Kingella pumchi TaxID=2779506 RepID=A0ABS9NKB5_9NEIS|nr:MULTISPECIES: amino acid ABC transporter permease [Kingella]MCG6503229.1 amino acid ABC transporter permease [Kingella pumchi]MDD2181941.1 amino acid ABC transporter permease [Kingella sp. SNUBH-2017]